MDDNEKAFLIASVSAKLEQEQKLAKSYAKASKKGMKR